MTKAVKQLGIHSALFHDFNGTIEPALTHPWGKMMDAYDRLPSGDARHSAVNPYELAEHGEPPISLITDTGSKCYVLKKKA